MHHPPRQPSLRDLVFVSVLTSSHRMGGNRRRSRHAQTVVVAAGLRTCYFPWPPGLSLIARLPLEGGLYVCTRRAFRRHRAGVLVAWNILAYALTTIATILFQSPASSLTWSPPRRLYSGNSPRRFPAFLPRAHLAGAPAVRASPRNGFHNISGLAMIAAFSLLIPRTALGLRHHAPSSSPLRPQLPDSARPRSPSSSDAVSRQPASTTLAIMAGESKVPSRDIGRSSSSPRPFTF